MQHTMRKLTAMCCAAFDLLLRNIFFPNRMSTNVSIFVPVPEKYMGRVIGKGGSNIIRIKQETQTRIDKSPKKGAMGGKSGFYITGGSDTGRKKAEQDIKLCVVSTIVSDILS